MKKHYDNMSDIQALVFEKYQTGLLEEVETCLANAREADDSVVKLPNFNEEGKHITHKCNMISTRAKTYWLERARMAYREITSNEDYNKLSKIETRCGITLRGRILG